jgi:hypothetical protein
MAAREARELQREFDELQAEAGIETHEDPTPPSGDLKADIESFTTLEACVRTRTPSDPLLGDAIDALGYDSLTRDACRILQALKAKTTDACKPIVASALRGRCESHVAVLTGDPSLCPAMNGGGLAAREPVCLARASRDERLCSAALATDRARCKALVLGRPGDCGRDPSCVRQVERYKSLLEKPSSHPAVATHLRIEVTEVSRSDAAATLLDIDEVAAGGAVVQLTDERVRLALGAPKSAAWLPAESPLASPRAFIEIAAPLDAVPGLGNSKRKDAGAAIELGPRDVRFDLLVPKVATLSAFTASERVLDIERLSTEPGGSIRFVLTSTLRDAPRVFRVKLDVETFVRERSGRGR